MEDDQSVYNDLVSKWLETTEKEHPHLLQGSRVTRFREMVNSFCDILVAIVHPDNPNAMAAVDPDGVRRRQFLHEIIKIGCCVTLKRYFGNGGIDVNATDDDDVTTLHLAAEYDKFEDLELLLKNEAKIEPDENGLTPLHIVALLTKPSRKMAKLLIYYMRKQQNAQLINAQTHGLMNASRNGNTALHFAVENERVSCEFILALESMNPVVKNDKGETAFHVAARSENPDIIVHMLQVFNPAEKGWEMKDIDSEEGTELPESAKEEIDERPTLLEICARRGNAKAVDLLIKCGADVTKKVLFLLVDESVKSMNDPRKTESLLDVYRTITDNCVLCEWLKAKPEERRSYPRRGIEPKAYEKKQGEIMLELLTVKDDSLNRNVIEHAIATGAKALLREIVNTPNVYQTTVEPGVVKYDVTDFIVARGRPNFLTRMLRRCSNRVTDSESQSSTNQRPSRSPDQSYLYLMTSRGVGDLWKYTGVLTEEPFLSASEPICTLVRVVYWVITLIQLIYMICFSYYFLPPPCSVNLTDNISVHCNVEPHAPTFLWPVWPIVMLVVLFPNVNQRLGLDLRNFLPKLFFILVIVWIISNYVENVTFFLSCTTLMHLFGWLVTLSLCIYTWENLFIFYFLVKEIMISPIILSSCVMSVFIIVSFSSAIHVLRTDSYAGNATYGDTIYDIFATAMGTGEFIKETNKGISDMSHHLRIAFAIYLCVSVIIMLNILTSTMIDRYQNAKVTAKISWRFYAVKSGVHSFLTSEVLSLSTILFIFHYCDKIISCLRPVCRHFYPEWYQYKVSLEERDDRLILTLSKDERTN